MSLLMDALKKAEQEKKEAARRLKEAQDKTGTHMQLQDDTPDSRPSAASKDASKDTDQQKQKQVPAPVIEKKSTPELSLAPLDEATSGSTPAPEPAADSSADGLNESSSPVSHDITIDHPEFSGAGKEPGGDNQAVVLSTTGETFALNDHSGEKSMAEPSADTVSSTLQEKHADKTLSESRSSKSIVSAAQLVKDMGGGKEAPTPVAAQTVFRASARNSGRQQMVEWVMFLGLLTVVLVAAGTFYYFRITPLVPDTASPLVARGIEAELTPPMVMPVPVVSPDSVSPAGTTTEAGPFGAGTTDDAVATSAPGPAAGQTAPVVTEEPEISLPTGAETVGPVMDDAVALGETPAEVSVRETVLPEKIEVDTAAIAISRGKSIDQHDQLVNKAYADYVAGNFVRAESAYHEVLKVKPENRDALLGIAAITWRKGNLQLAWEYYLKVLKLYPRDVTARTALVNLQGNANPVQSESTVKLMIQEDPDADFLYFTLGNIYASQLRWEQAQQAFFEAWRRQSGNSDYAYNLAVSLDHIGQAKTARKYYRMALDLADKAPQTGFNTAAIMARLNTLSSLPEND